MENIFETRAFEIILISAYFKMANDISCANAYAF